MALTQQLSYINTRDHGETTISHQHTANFNPFSHVGSSSVESVYNQQPPSSYPSLIKPQNHQDEDVSMIVG